MTVGLIVERHPLSGPWGGVAWRPVAVFPEPPDAAPWTPLGHFGSATRYYAGTYDIALYSTETANYRDNLEAAEATLWVVMRATGPEPPVEVVAITADPSEGEGSTEAGSNIVETVAMPAEVAGVVARFIAEHHVERPVYKRQRDRHRRGPGGSKDGPSGTGES